MSPGGSHGLGFMLYILFGAGIVFGAAWLVTGILPFVDTVSFGSTTGWVLCGVGGVAGYLLCAVALDGWRDTWRSWAGWAMIVVPLFGLSAIVGWYIQAHPDSALVVAIAKLGQRVPEDAWLPIIVFFPVLALVILCAVAILKYYIKGEHRQQRETYRRRPRNRS